MTGDVGMVSGLWRYPIKSLDGERRQELTFDRRGARSDSEEASGLVREIAGAGWSIRCEHSISHFEGAVHVVTTATLATLSAALGVSLAVDRLRPNILLETIGRINEACAGVYAEVITPGTIRVGVPAALLADGL